MKKKGRNDVEKLSTGVNFDEKISFDDCKSCLEWIELQQHLIPNMKKKAKDYWYFEKTWWLVFQGILDDKNGFNPQNLFNP